MNLRFLWSFRFIITLKAFLTVLSMYLQRNGFNIEIICMTCDDNSNSTNNSFTHFNERRDCFSWSNNEVALMNGIFFWGYAITQAFSGVIMHKIGLKFNINWSIFLSSISTFLIPFATYSGHQLITFLRFLTGVGQGFLWPFIQSTVSSWSPDNERSIHLAIITCGVGIGPAIAFLLSGVFCELTLAANQYIFFRNGWAAYFYFSGCVGFVDLILSVIILSDTPNENRFISKSEAIYINARVRGAAVEDGRDKPQVPIRWKGIFTSIPMWAFLVALTLCDVGLYATWTVIPQFMNDVIEFDISESGLYNSLPYIFHVISIVGSGFLSEYLRSFRLLSASTICKMFHSIGCMGAAICLIAISFTGPSTRAASIVILIIGFSCHGLILGAGIVLICNDFAGQLSGVVFTIGNTASAFLGFFVPIITARIVTEPTASQWRIAFIVYALCYTVSAITLIVFGSSNLQYWAIPTVDNSRQEIAMKEKR